MFREYQSTIIRWLFGSGLLGIAYWCAITGYNRLDFVLLLCGVAFFVLGVIALWKTIFHLATRPFTLFIDSIFLPGGKFAKPSLNLKLPAYYINEGRFDEALIEYQKALKYYPDETEAYEKAIWLYLEVFGEPAEAEKLMRKAKRRHLVIEQGLTLRVSDGAHRTG